LPVLRGHKPQIIVTINAEDLFGPDTNAGAGEMGFGATISAARARWLACDGAVTRIVMGPDGMPLDHGRTLRLVPPHVRRAAEVRDGGACSPAAGPRPSGATSTTCLPGSMAARPAWTTPRCCASGTTRRSTTVSGWNDNPTADGAPGDPTEPRS
jgi:hypothetical protein